MNASRSRKQWAHMIRAAAIAASIAMVAAACSGSPSDSNGEVKIGLAAAFTGNAAFLGPALAKGSKVAITDINSAGGVDGNKVKLVTSDTAGNAQGAVSAVDKLLKVDKVAGLVGPTSVTVMSVLDRIQASKIPTMVLGSTSALDKSIKGKTTFRVTPSDTLMGPAIAQTALSKGFKTCSLVTESLEGAQSIGQSIKSAYEGLGGKIDREVKLAIRQSSYSSELLKILSAPTSKCVFIEISPESGAQFWQNASQSKAINQPLFIGTDTLLNADSMKTLKPVADTAKIDAISPASVGPGRDTYVDLYKKAYPKEDGPENLSDLAYDSTVILALAMADAKSSDPSKYVSHIRTVSNGGTTCLSFSACKKLLDAGENFNFEGASGSNDIQADGNSISGFGVFQVRKGASAQVSTITQEQITKLVQKLGM